MDNQDRIKLFTDACKESFEVAKDVKEQQDIVREDLQHIFNTVLRANAEELKTCNSYITNKYPDHAHALLRINWFLSSDASISIFSR